MAPSATSPPPTTTNSQPIDLGSNYVQIINGKSAPTEHVRHGINPASLEPKPDVPVATQADLDRAVDAAKAAFKKWSRVPYEERRAAVLAFADAIDAQRTEFRDLLISEQGKPVRLENIPSFSFVVVVVIYETFSLSLSLSISQS
jgi:acyl-CoA reductase-like NAD-dependent aldehyde dehydrogenase